MPNAPGNQQNEEGCAQRSVRREHLKRQVERQYDNLHAIAVRLFRNERSDHSLSPTALWHELQARMARQLELRVFGELTLDECAEVLGVSARMLGKEWTYVRNFMRQQLQ